MRQNKEIHAFFAEKERELNRMAKEVDTFNNYSLNSNRASMLVQFIRFAQKTTNEIAERYNEH